ncbi:helix-turn-helix transcriptional regulator [Halobacterium zhouii]|uniref:helix-turn-helix transcriptional regulator n=1 Tax=Halobacterium zhouii TaxID=2902624 RepID=UPI001E4D69EB|nr:hypothetical protein [Halobacterium zhouii]
MNRGVVCVLLALVVVAGVPVGAATPSEATGMPEEFDPDSVSLSANLHENGSATWTFTYRMRLSNDSEVAAFESLQADIQNDSSAYTETFRKRIAETVAAAADTTNRDMSVSNVAISTRVNTFNEETLGVVTYSFKWSNFAAVNGDRLVAGDALEGFYLDNETSLRISWPESYGLVDVDPDAQRPNENAVEWAGPKEFSTGEPRVVVSPGADDATDSEDANTPPPDDGSGNAGLSELLVPAVVGALAAAGVLGAAGWYYREQYGDDRTPGGGSDDAAAGGGDGAATTGADESAAGESTDDEPPAELLSNEERVKRFLDREGGRAKQQALVDEMDWTEAKTSQVVKQMRENDEVESFRIGRENVLKLPDDEE